MNETRVIASIDASILPYCRHYSHPVRVNLFRGSVLDVVPRPRLGNSCVVLSSTGEVNAKPGVDKAFSEAGGESYKNVKLRRQRDMSRSSDGWFGGDKWYDQDELQPVSIRNCDALPYDEVLYGRNVTRIPDYSQLRETTVEACGSVEAHQRLCQAYQYAFMGIRRFPVADISDVTFALLHAGSIQKNMFLPEEEKARCLKKSLSVAVITLVLCIDKAHKNRLDLDIGIETVTMCAHTELEETLLLSIFQGVNETIQRTEHPNVVLFNDLMDILQVESLGNFDHQLFGYMASSIDKALFVYGHCCLGTPYCVSDSMPLPSQELNLKRLMQRQGKLDSAVARFSSPMSFLFRTERRGQDRKLERLPPALSKFKNLLKSHVELLVSAEEDIGVLTRELQQHTNDEDLQKIFRSRISQLVFVRLRSKWCFSEVILEALKQRL